ncbi:MAG: hypothetical protein O9274_14895 [Limnobacter sp.]|mgnify:FL=1|uniref:hypothetical protein n=1 Tax=Limnobacter sp. TaxID=2003368 RepID=UPI0022BBC1AC|nr:hypothetical protein [Limnobacter sp.]MCZ8016988.1 hypothetical protein [Limnobacter sp.]
MKHINPLADIWVIDQGKAWLLRQDPSNSTSWQKEMGISIEEFMGSAIALASFTHSDTLVFYNLQSGKATTDKTTVSEATEQFWVGIKQDPLRLLLKRAGHEQHEIKTLQSMGKKTQVISCADPALFERATPMMLINPNEQKHLEHWLAARKEGHGQQRSYLGLLANLWIKPQAAYQNLRLVAVCCTLFSLAVAHHVNEFKTDRQLNHFAHDVQEALKNSQETSENITWAEWGIQLGKFGKDKRANLNAVNIQWNEEGHVHTQATLNRERKRVPKGCTLETPRRASCSTKGLSR